ncbi:hypothetical protein [Flindersiella endophytica]
MSEAAAEPDGLGQNMLAVGLVLAPSGLVMMAMAPLSARITNARGPKTRLMLGAAVVAAGYALSILDLQRGCRGGAGPADRLVRGGGGAVAGRLPAGDGDGRGRGKENS